MATQGALGAGKGILNSLFGAKVGGVIDYIARMAGVRISSAGYGQDNPVAPNDTEEGRAKNRRLELVVVKR